MKQPIQTNFTVNISDNLDNDNISFVIPDNYIGQRLDTTLANIIPDISRTKLTNWLKDKFILVNGKEAKAKDKIMSHTQINITLPFDEEAFAYEPQDIALNVIYEDDDVIVINKPAGLTVHPGNGNWSGTLLNGLLFHYPELKNIARAGIVHRLDKDTTGLMVVARSLLAQVSLIEQLQNRSVSRIYRAIVEGRPPKEGLINKNIGRDVNNRTKMAVVDFGGKEAITHYRTLKYVDGFSYVECKLETGRTHQIRVHFKHLKHPLIGDPTYGTKKINYASEIVMAIEDLNRQALHALQLSFIHPSTNERVTFKTRMADDMRNLWHAIEGSQELSYDEDDFDEIEDSNWEVIYVRE